MKRLFNSCAGWRAPISLLAAGALPPAERAEAERHLAACQDCQEHYRQVKIAVHPFTRWHEGLDAIQPSASAQARWKAAIQTAVQPRHTATSEPGALFSGWWRQAIWPYRHIWAGMAAVWLIMWVINSRMLATPGTASSAKANSSAVLVQTIASEKQILAELSPPSAEQPAEPPRPSVLPPRSERTFPWKAC